MPVGARYCQGLPVGATDCKGIPVSVTNLGKSRRSQEIPEGARFFIFESTLLTYNWGIF